MPYDPKAIEARWQAHWQEHATFRSELDPSKPKFYVLDMFPYPSGAGLHVGHPKGYIATDVVSRYKRMRGFNVLHPMGWDAFGLPAEQYAIETGTHPRETTRRNIETFKRQLTSLGTDYDWSREIDTTDPGYMRWTQWIFRKLHERGLAYLAEVPVNWCPALGTVLANEEVIDGKSERGGHPVIRVPLRQWMLRITAYADRLIDDLDDVDWPEAIKKMQRDWVGRSLGARIRFELPSLPGESDRGLHDAPGHALRRDLPRARARAPARRAARDAGPAGGGAGLRRARRAPQRAGAAGRGREQDGGGDGRLRAPSRHAAASCRSGSRTTCSRATGRARSWPSPRTTRATSSSRARSGSRSSRWWRAATCARPPTPATA